MAGAGCKANVLIECVNCGCAGGGKSLWELVPGSEAAGNKELIFHLLFQYFNRKLFSTQ